MKKLFIVLAFFSASAHAASTGSLVLSGTVALINSIVITLNGSNNTTLDIVNGESAKNIASVAETSNNPIGYKIMISSANASELRLSSDGTKKTTYQISYDGGSYTTLTTTPTQIKNVSSLTGLTTYNSAVLINVSAYANAPAGTYSDTVTLSIVAN